MNWLSYVERAISVRSGPFDLATYGGYVPFDLNEREKLCAQYRKWVKNTF